MLTSIFSKSKPVNFIIIAVLVVITFVLQLYATGTLIDFSYLKLIVPPFIALYYVFLTDFIISKNDLTKKHSYGILILGLSVIIVPEIFNNLDDLIANLLVLFALRRLFSLHTKRSLSKKFFDAVFWISLASLFNSWAVLYLIIVIVALINYWQSEIKYVVVSLFGALTVFILLIVFNIVYNDSYILKTNFNFAFDFNISNYNNTWDILRLTILSSVFLWSTVYYLRAISSKNRKQKPIHILVLISAIISVAIVILAPEKSGSELVFFIVPFSIIAANYLEMIKEKWFKDVFLFLLVLIPISKLVL